MNKQMRGACLKVLFICSTRVYIDLIRSLKIFILSRWDNCPSRKKIFRIADKSFIMRLQRCIPQIESMFSSRKKK